MTINPGDPLSWYNNVTGMLYAMTTNGTTITSKGTVHTEPNLSWFITATGEFDGNGITDYLWRNSSNGQVYQMLMSNLTTKKAGNKVIWTEANSAWRFR